MFSLIITIITIALVAALAISSIYYGGDAFTSGSSQASASTIVNQAQQIAGASDIYRASNSGSYPENIDALTPQYLSSTPVLPASYFAGETATDWTVDARQLTLSTNVTGEICDEIGRNPNEPFYCTVSGTYNENTDNSGDYDGQAGAFTFSKTLFQ